MRIRQHIPPFVDIDRPPAIELESGDQIWALPFVRERAGRPDFDHWEQNEGRLIEITKDGKWWVVAIMSDDLPNIPYWKHPYWKHPH